MLLTVNTKYGTVQGVACDAKGVAAYKGIPYAKPPIGDLRWQAPQKPDSWEGVRLCDTFGSPCMQTLRPEGNFYRTEFYTHKFHPYPPKWGEDCLYLNIWTAAENQKAGLPVMVWIHGGGFTQGYGHEPRYDGQTLASNGVILVSINYRLNIFGFFGCKALTEESARSGNYGILDQLAAIEWIKENIEAFGGNPNNITIFGQSAGAISVQTIAASPLAAGKVNRAIMQSGGGLTVPEMRNDLRFLEEQGAKFMRKIKVNNLAELRAIPADELMRLVAENGFGAWTSFPIVVDDYLLKEDKGLAFKHGANLDIEYMAGSTIDESQILPVYEPGSITKDNFHKQMNGWFRMMGEACDPADDREALALANKKAGIEWFAEHRALAYAAAEHNSKPVYAYVFTHQPPGEDRPGAFHSACIWYAMGNLKNCWRPFTREDEKLSETMVQYWTNFAKTGNPNGKGLPPWTAFDPKLGLEMRLDLECKMYDFGPENPEVMRLTQMLLKEE